MNSPWKAVLTVRPSFHDTDPMGVVWHGNYLKFFEAAREALFRAIGYDYRTMNATGYIWPVVDVRVRYRHPWMLEEAAEVSAAITEYENRLVVVYEVRRVADGVLLTRGETVHMAFDLEKKTGLLRSPDILFEKLGMEVPQ